jgi:Hsp20/alpha crystallin family.
LPFRKKRLAEFLPKFNISENDKGVEITAEVPGIDLNDVEVSLREGVLKINLPKSTKAQENVRKIEVKNE